jgi:drug/metabolite transporter (DMT)-like permease
MSTLPVYAALGATMFFWGLSFVGTKLALLSFSPFANIFLRFGLASVFFLVLFVLRGFPRFSARQHFKLFLLSVFEPGLYFLFESYGIKLTSASKASLIIALVPVAVALLSRVFLKERLTARAGVGIGLSLVGVAVLVLGGGTVLAFDSSLLGDLLVLGAVITAAAYMILARDLGVQASPVGITGFQTFYGALFFAPFFLFGVDSGAPRPILPESLAALIFLAGGATIGGFLCYNWALSKVLASKAAIFLNGIPVVTAIGAWLLLGERLTPMQLAGATLVMAAVWLTSSGREALEKKKNE